MKVTYVEVSWEKKDVARSPSTGVFSRGSGDYDINADGEPCVRQNGICGDLGKPPQNSTKMRNA